MATGTPLKRVLADSTNTAQNIANSPVSATKKRKLDITTPTAKAFRKPAGPHSSAPGSSQPKSHFETEVLEKLSQNLDGLRKKNQEKDQQWPRPSLDDFRPDSDNLVFQQIEAEEGSLMGGKTTVRLFGVTEVCCFGSKGSKMWDDETSSN
jgi:DNA polymerase delta subunit 1